ncbi:MAG: type II secretion system F family protein [bacterium]
MDLLTEYSDVILVALVAITVGGLALGLLFPWFTGSAAASKRVASVSDRSAVKSAGGLRDRFKEDTKDARRKQIQESLKQFETREKQRSKRVSVQTLLMRAGLDVSPQQFWIASGVVGAVCGVLAHFSGVPLVVALVAALVGAVGVPRWILKYITKRRQEVFLNDFADAIDVMVRGLKSGLPVNDALKVIASEMAAPVGPEFAEVVEGQRVGISIDQGIERMFERVPLAEVNFLSIVVMIQQKTGGNLAEALSNLSRVLRDRKKLKARIVAVSQEAKASAVIVGSLPFLIMGGVLLVSPNYLNPLFETEIGHILLVVSALWMLTGVLVMRKMINFDF